MTFFQWRRFHFFDVERDVDKGVLSESLSKDNSTLTCATGGRGHLALGDSSGRLHLLDRRLTESKVLSTGNNSSEIRLICRASKSGLLVCLCADGTLKTFDTDKLSKQDSEEETTLVRTTRLPANSGKPSALSVQDSLSLIAVGTEKGSLILIRGDLKKDRGTKIRTIFQSDQGQKISGLVFKGCKLYVATTKEVLLFDVSIKDKESWTSLDNIGCNPGLATSIEGLADAHFATARQDAVYFYSTEGRGQCYAIEGEKVGLFWFRNYLVVVTAEGGENDIKNNKHILTVFDVQNKFIAFTAPVKPLKALAGEWGTLYALSQDNKLLQLNEKDIQSKLELLFKKNFYDIAIKIAKGQHYDSDGLVDIFRQYGDHLYAKGDHAAAIDNYVKTIGHLEPSYVIRRFLDAHKIHNLTAYLQALHKQGLANEDHTILLLNCYTKLKDGNRLDEFIFKDRDSLDFDVQVAIKVCRQAGYNKHALTLAANHNLHEWYLIIQLEDVKNHKDALEYISGLDFANAETSLKKYGTTLMNHLPCETTQFLKVLCTDYKAKGQPLVTQEMLQGDADASSLLRANPDDFLHLFIMKNQRGGGGVVDFLEHMVKIRPDVSQLVYTTLLEHYLSDYSSSDDKSKDLDLQRRILQLLSNPDAKFDTDHALVLCQLHAFTRGTLYLYELNGLTSEILKLHIQFGDVEAALATCRKFGPQNPNLWVQALQLMAGIECQQDSTGSEQHIAEILHTIEEQRLMSPLLVIRTLSGSAKANLGVVRNYLLNVLTHEDSQIVEHSSVIDQYKVDTAKVQNRIKGLVAQSSTFQASKCSACNHSLELPTVHFLCGHSYHQHCFQSYSDAETECPACQPENKKIVDIVKSQQQSRDHHDAFHSLLEKADDGFSVVAEYFGRGVFRKNIDLNTLQSVQDDGTQSKAVAKISEQMKKRVDVQEKEPERKSRQIKRNEPIIKRESPPSKPAAVVESKNPFTRDSPPKHAAVVETKNPFGDPEKGQQQQQQRSAAAAANPFGEPDEEETYDESLNPFS